MQHNVLFHIGPSKTEPSACHTGNMTVFPVVISTSSVALAVITQTCRENAQKAATCDASTASERSWLWCCSEVHIFSLHMPSL